MNHISQESLKSLVYYKDGALYWIPKSDSRGRQSVKNNTQVGSKLGSDYLRVHINKRKYYVHQLVFLYHHGFIPNVIDHIDGCTENNKIENLREATKATNAYNSVTRKDNTSGHRNVMWSKAAKKWVARITVNMKPKHLGCFEDFEFACLVADEARRLYHGDFARI